MRKRVEIPTILKTGLTRFTSFEYKVVANPDRGVSEIDNVNYGTLIKIQLKRRRNTGDDGDEVTENNKSREYSSGANIEIEWRTGHE